MKRLMKALALAALLAFAFPLFGAAAGGNATKDGGGDFLSGLKPVKGPATLKIGSEGEVKIPAGTMFFHPKDARTLLERMENITSGEELGLVASEDRGWLMVFEFDDSGYVKDTGEDAEIDADAILDGFKEGAKAANKEKVARGWATSEVVGWSIPPYYNKESKNLEWALRFKSEGREYENYSVRILGRGGVMKVIFAGDAEDFEDARPVIAGYSFLPGKTHAEWRQGDKIASYGLAALVAGGAAAAVAKSGLLGKFLKPILVAVAAAFAAIFKIFRRKKKNTTNVDLEKKD